ncbi:MAG TPA: hypothetical protein VFA06_04720 [Actinocrinis sp.]|uniref:hypothetical protein n=1 Tax=Actinocrinis sp. TaxID=1920516 RepID=UPI002D27BCEC|nr:hypothetical protein [Actinocrinis sp.]HZU55148.1 hypothetical protein [Actinocrinis sp.]
MLTFHAARRTCAVLITAALAATAAACSSSSTTTASASASTAGNSASMPGMGMGPSASPSATAAGMAGMGMAGDDPMYSGTGLSATSGGFTFAPTTTRLTAHQPQALHFKIRDAQGAVMTAFVPDQTKMMHFYLIRSDLTGFQHLHPTMAADGTWTASLAALAPGDYRAYVAFNAKNTSGTTVAEVLSSALTVPGTAAATALPAAATTTSVDGYTLTVSGEAMAAMSHILTITVTKNGKPVTDLQPYLQNYAHLTAIHAGDLAFAHLHPEGAAAMTDAGGPTLTFNTLLPSSGDWRFFIQFQTGGVLHTAAITLHAS